MRRLWTLLLLAGCAGGGASSYSRAYERPETRQLRLQRLDVVIVASPAATSGPVLTGGFFEAPSLETTLLEGATDEATEAALENALEARLAKAGYQARFFRQRPPRSPSPPIGPLPRIDTSTASVATSSTGVVVAPSGGVPSSSGASSRVIAIFDILDRGAQVDPGVLQNLSEYLSARISAGPFQVVPRSDLKARLDERKAESYKNCYDQNCQIELGREMAAEKTLATQILRIADTCQVSAVMYDLRSASTEQAVTEEAACEERALLSAVKKVAERLTSSSPPTPVVEDAGLVPGLSLEAFLAQSEADAVLVVRVVPVDAFYVFASGGQVTAVDTGEGAPRRIQADQPLLRTGRLLVGQAFLYDRATRLRLWSRQVPDFPNNGRLAENDAFLGYGVVTDPAREAEVSIPERARRAAQNFTPKMLDSFPPAKAQGSESARARLAGVDRDADARREAVLDESHLGVELGFGYGGEQVGTSLNFGDSALPDLGTGALAPSGVIRVGPRLHYRAPGGLSFLAAANFGVAPGSFARTYFQGQNQTGNRLSAVSVNGVSLWGAEVRGGYAFLISPTLSVVPSVGVYFEAWSLDASPTVTVPDDLHLRLGVVGGGDLVWRSAPDSIWYLRGGPVLRVGLDTAGPAALGAGLDVGVGLSL